MAKGHKTITIGTGGDPGDERILDFDEGWMTINGEEDGRDELIGLTREDAIRMAKEILYYYDEPLEP